MKTIFLCALRFIFLLGFLFPGHILPTPPIEVLVSSENRIYEQTLTGLESVLESNLKISYLESLDASPGQLEAYLKQLDESETPAIVTLGVPATLAAKNVIKKKSIIFTMVNAPKLHGLEQGAFCGVTVDISLGEFFRTLKEIKPEARTVVTFYSNSEGEFISGEGEYLDTRHKLLFSRKKVSSRENFLAEIQAQRGKMDAFMLLNDPLYGKKEFDELSDFSKKNGIVLMTSFPALVKSGATFGLSPDFFKVGYQTALMVSRVMNNASRCADEGIINNENLKLHINEEYAKSSGITIPSEVLDKFLVTNLYEIATQLYRENKLNSAKVIFEKILTKDPAHKSALNYLQLILEQQTGNKTGEFLKLAEKYLNEKKFAQAKHEYQKILKINPNFSKAKDGIQACVQGQSELERAQANGYAKNGDYARAIQYLMISLKTNPGNQLAKNDLTSVRIKGSDQIPEVLKTAIKYYNDREYDKALESLEYILLIQPEHKESVEYQRLSIKKRDAIKSLQEKSK